MPVQIGAPSHSFSDPTGLLSDCHRRIEVFLDALAAVAGLGGQALSGEARRSLELALRYFREAAPKHTADEEVSLFPLLRSLPGSDLQAAISQLDALQADHRFADPLHALVDQLGLRYLQNSRLSAQEAGQFRESVHKLQVMYRRHIAIEDEQIFTVAARILSPEHKKQIAREMAERRSLKPVVR
jgi:hemerythrin-like domain-containing protein